MKKENLNKWFYYTVHYYYLQVYIEKMFWKLFINIGKFQGY